jgi:hypothetical protein
MTRFELATPAPEDGALFSNITSSKTKTGFLLIETFRKLFNPQNDGHLDQLRVAIYYLSESVRISHFGESSDFKTIWEDL